MGKATVRDSNLSLFGIKCRQFKAAHEKFQKGITSDHDREVVQAYAAYAHVCACYIELAERLLARIRLQKNRWRTYIHWCFTWGALSLRCLWDSMYVSRHMLKRLEYNKLPPELCLSRQRVLRVVRRYREALVCIQAGLDQCGDDTAMLVRLRLAKAQIKYWQGRSDETFTILRALQKKMAELREGGGPHVVRAHVEYADLMNCMNDKLAAARYQEHVQSLVITRTVLTIGPDEEDEETKEADA